MLSPELRDPAYVPSRGRLRALAIVSAAFIAVIGASIGGFFAWQKFQEILGPARNVQQVQTDFQRLGGFIQEQWPDSSQLPEDMAQIRERWSLVRPSEPLPVDPFDRSDYGYLKFENSYELWSSGIDGKSGTADDMSYEWPQQQTGQ